MRVVGTRRLYLKEAEFGADLALSIASHPLVKDYRTWKARLRDLAIEYRVGLPAQIGWDFYLRAPRQREASGNEGQGLGQSPGAEEGLSLGGENMMVWCSVTGQLLQTTESDAGRERYVSLQDERLVFAAEAYHAFGRIRNHLYAVRDASSLHKLSRGDRLAGSLHCRELCTPFFCSERIRFKKKSPAYLILKAFECFADRPALGQPWRWPDVHGLTSLSNRGYRWALYRDLRPAVLKIASGLSKIVGRGAHVAICGFNTIEWTLCDFACAVAGLVSVGIHSNYDDKEAIGVLNHSEAQVIVVSKAYLQSYDTARTGSEEMDMDMDMDMETAWKLPTILPHLLHAKVVVVMDASMEALKILFQKHESAFLSACAPREVGVAGDSIARFIAEEREMEVCEEASEDGGPLALFTLLYTSGSSGKPKVVQQSRSAFFDGVSMAVYASPLITVSYIPLSHSSDRFKLWSFLSNGGRVGFASYSARHWQQHETAKKDAVLCEDEE